MRKLNQLMNLKKRVALITGGAGHLGFAIAESLAEAGAKIVLLDVNEKACKQKARQIQRKYKVKTMALVMDLTDLKQLRAVPQQIRE